MRVLAKFTPDEQGHLRAIGQRVCAGAVAEVFQQPIALILPEQVLDPRVHRDVMEMDGEARIVAESADVEPLGLQLRLQGFLHPGEQPAHLRQGLLGKVGQ
ncbi:hypothetical protein D3C80_1636330 [compost metagenome]